MAVDLGETVRAECGLPLVFKDDLRPQVAGVRRDKGLTLPTQRQGKSAGRGFCLLFQSVIQIHRDSPLVV